MVLAFQPPANLKDFDRAADPQVLRQAWHQTMDEIVNSNITARPAFYNPLDPPSADVPAVAAPEWTGLPRTIKRLIPTSIAAAAALVDNAIPMGAPDPMEGPNFTPAFFEATSGAPFAGPAYRPQDEYLEWAVRREPDGVITEITFTCEAPEYWAQVASDENLLLDLYKELVGDNTITLADLVFPRTVTWDNPFDGRQRFEAGEYNPYNRWNMIGAVHLTQPANTLGAEITLAKDASRLYGNPVPVTTDPDLVCCAPYGGVNRMSDPTIGSQVNTQVQLGNRVTLRDPIGLYIRGIRTEVFSLPDNSPFQRVNECFAILRPAVQDVTDMIVRARFRVPDGITFNGAQLRVGDLKVNGEQIVTGGQVADVITMTLYALAIAGAPVQPRQICRRRPCPDLELPDFIRLFPFDQPCPAVGISALTQNLELARAAASATPEAPALEAAAPSEPAMTRFASSRVRGGE